MNIEIHGVDAARAIELYSGDGDMYLRCLRRFFAYMPAAIEKIRIVAPEALGDYHIAIHAIKGMNATIAATEAVKAAEKLEAMAKTGDFPGVLSCNDQFVHIVEKLIDDIGLWLEKAQGIGQL